MGNGKTGRKDWKTIKDSQTGRGEHFAEGRVARWGENWPVG
jgi:hypothetical protein